MITGSVPLRRPWRNRFLRKLSSKGLPYVIDTAPEEATTAEDLYRDNFDTLKQPRTKYNQNGVIDILGFLVR